MIELTRKRTIELLEEAVMELGTDHESFCIYAVEKDDESLAPQCIIGRVFARLDESGAALEMLHSREGRGIMQFTDAELGVQSETGVYSILHEAQRAQDEGNTWGYAFNQAQQLAYALDDKLPFRSNLFNN